MIDPLTRRCDVCRAKPGEPCSNTILPGSILPGRAHHWARITAPDKDTEPIEKDGS